MNFNIKIFRDFIPKKIIKECIVQYEDKDIYLSKNKSYYILKENLLSKKIILHKDFFDFISGTRGSGYTVFLRHQFSYNKYLSNLKLKEKIKFKKNIYIYL